MSNELTDEEIYDTFKKMYIKYGVDLTELNSFSPEKVGQCIKFFLYNLSEKKKKPLTKEDHDFLKFNIARYI